MGERIQTVERLARVVGETSVGIEDQPRPGSEDDQVPHVCGAAFDPAHKQAPTVGGIGIVIIGEHAVGGIEAEDVILIGSVMGIGHGNRAVGLTDDGKPDGGGRFGAELIADRVGDGIDRGLPGGKVVEPPVG